MVWVTKAVVSRFPYLIRAFKNLLSSRDAAIRCGSRFPANTQALESNPRARRFPEVGRVILAALGWLSSARESIPRALSRPICFKRVALITAQLMDIFINKVPVSVREDDLKLQLVKILHKPPFKTDSTELPMNFSVELFRKPIKNRRMGILTLDSVQHGNQFLEIYPLVPFSIAGQRIEFKRSTRPTSAARVAAVQGSPWVDLEDIRFERERLQDIEQPTGPLEMKFGKVGRNGDFSAEHSFRATITCRYTERRLELEVVAVKQRGEGMFDLLGAFGEQSVTKFWYRSSTVRGIVRSVSLTDNPLPQLTIEFNSPATFTENTTASIFDSAPTQSQRKASISGMQIMAPVSQALHINFATNEDLQAFLKRCRDIHLPRPISKLVTLRENLTYGEESRARLDTIIASLDFELAFQLERAMWMGVLEPNELCELEPDIRQLHAENRDIAPAIFQLFASSLRVPSLNDAVHRAVPPPSRRRRRGRTKKRQLASALSPDLSSQLHEARDAFITETLRPKRRYSSLPASFYPAFHLILTPSTQQLEGPLPDQSNGILRNYGSYQNRFLRVSFRDEDKGLPRGNSALAIDNLLKERFRPALTNGVTVAGRHYDFLGYSMSGLKEYTFIFVTPFEMDGVYIDAASIRRKFGDIPKAIHRPALLGARWGQMFSASTPSIRLTKDQIVYIDDKTASGAAGQNAVFTDSCSPISLELAEVVRDRLWPNSNHSIPSLFQIRIGGAKGVASVDPTLKGKVLCLRPSQVKFQSEESMLDITATSSRPILLFLNRPMITLLEHHGVPKSSFLRLQDLAINDAKNIKKSLDSASSTFALHGLGQSFRLETLFRNLAKMGIELAEDTKDEGKLQFSLLKTVIGDGVTHVLREIKHRCRIRVHGSYTLIGVADEFDCLEEGQIYAQIEDKKTNRSLTVRGRVLVTRSPQIHPGDLQFVDAVAPPELKHLKNAVVFSTKGSRSLPSMLGGGDTDGDIFNIILDKSLHPPRGYTAEPGDYEPLPPTQTQHECGIADVADFVINYIKSDILGQISSLHLRISDLKGADCDDCLKLAAKASHAVDFPKVGTPVDYKSLPQAGDTLKPDFMSGEGYRQPRSGSLFYPSTKVLGELFRRVPLDEERDYGFNVIDFELIDQTLLSAHRTTFQRFRLKSQWVPDTETLEEMHHVVDDYSEQLLVIAKTHTVYQRSESRLSESELVSSAIMESYNEHRQRKNTTVRMNIQTHELARAIRREFDPADILTPHSGIDEDWSDDEDDLDFSRLVHKFGRARAGYIAAKLAFEEDENAFGPQSFILIALGVMLEVVNILERMD